MTEFHTPISWPRGLFTTSTILNEQIRDNMTHVKEQLRGLAHPSTFGNMLLGTHPSADLAAFKVYLRRGEWILVSDATGTSEAITITTPLVADITAVGPGGLDTGTEAVSSWYQIYLIRKSSDGTLALMLHKYAPTISMDASAGSMGGQQNFRSTSSLQKLAQSFQLATLNDVAFVYAQAYLAKVGAPTGYVWATIETDTGGFPSGSAIATSPSYAVADLPTGVTGVPVIFYADVTSANLLSGATYHLVLNSDVVVNASNYLTVNVASIAYGSGQNNAYNGTTWASQANDLYFGINVRRADVAPTMPAGYDQKCLLGYAFNNAAGNLVKFVAHDKTVTPLEKVTVFSPGGTVLPELLAIPTPPIPARVRFIINGAAAAFVAVSSVRAGFAVVNDPRVNGQVLWNAAGAAMMDPGVLNTDLGMALIRSTSAGTASVWLSSWEWL